MRFSPTPLAGESRRRRMLIWSLAGLCTGLAALVVLALPLLKAAYDAHAAKNDLLAAEAALESNDLDSASQSVASARDHIDSAQGNAQGIGGVVWSRVPV